MLRWLKRLAAPVVAVALLGMASAAGANTINISLTAGTNPTPDGGGFRYSYSALASVNSLHSGDYFVLYDFAGYTGDADVLRSGLLATNFTLSSTLDGPTPYAQGHVDSTSVPDIVLTYNGPDLNDQTILALGTFSAKTTVSSTGTLTYSAQDHANFIVDPARGQQGNTGTVNGPVAVPLPATASMGGALLACVAAAGIWRRRNSSQAAA